MSKSIYTHIHHIIPRHAGGTDDEWNKVRLTTEEHALAHKKLFFIYGRWQDEIAYQGLYGMIGKEEATRRANSEAHKGVILSKETRAKISKSKMGNKYNLGRKDSEETKKKKSASGKVKVFTVEHKANLSAANKGRVLTEEWKQKLSRASIAAWKRKKN
jgi:hypothetical protein